MNAAGRRPLTLLICALGGEGGGVLAEWLVDTANRCGYAAQSTSIPGVAQRTGSTTYYFEVFPVPLAELDGRKPVFSLYPVPGALDALVSSELLETVRHIGNGMACADRTLVVTSSSRTLTTAEKLQLGDGRAPSDELLGVVRRHSRDACIFDMAEVARQSGTVLSAVLFGAIAGSGVLPFSRAACEQAVGRSGRGIDASLRGFALAFDIAAGAAPLPAKPVPVVPLPTKAAVPGSSAEVPALPVDVAREFPGPTHAMLGAGHARMLEYQGPDYARLYLQRIRRVLAAERETDPTGGNGYTITSETARYLALWMAFDDIVRVAELKCRASRQARVRREVGAADDDLVHVYDHFKPGVPEFAALLPEKLARVLVRWDRRRQQAGRPALALPLKVGSHTIAGFLALRVLASLKWLRKLGSRYAQEQALIGRWLDAIERGARSHWELGNEIALCGRLIKGYGGTHDRGRDNLLHVLDHLADGDSQASPGGRAQAIRAARIAALADEGGKALDQVLVRHGVAPRPVKAQPVTWVKKPRATASTVN